MLRAIDHAGLAQLGTCYIEHKLKELCCALRSIRCAPIDAVGDSLVELRAQIFGLHSSKVDALYATRTRLYTQPIGDSHNGNDSWSISLDGVST